MTWLPLSCTSKVHRSLPARSRTSTADEARAAGARNHGRSSSCVHGSHRLEARANVFAKELRLFPGGKVAADVVLLVIDEFRIRLLRPAPRRRVYLVRKRADANGNSHALDVKEAELILPIEAARRNTRLRQPVKGDVIENVIARKAARVTEKGRCDHLVAVLVVIENPGRKRDRRIRQPVEGLRAVPHLDGVAEMLRIEVAQLFVCVQLVAREAGRRRGGESGFR